MRFADADFWTGPGHSDEYFFPVLQEFRRRSNLGCVNLVSSFFYLLRIHGGSAFVCSKYEVLGSFFFLIYVYRYLC
jgi:hypothetical protein